MPAHVVGPGVVIAATWPDARLDAWIAEHDFAGYTAHTVTDPARFRDSVVAARGLDYGITEQQLDLGLRGIAIAVKDRKGECVGAVGMTVSVHAGSSNEAAETLLPPLREVARALRPLL